MIENRKSALLLDRASRAVIEALETRQLLSATLSESSSLLVFNAVQNSSASTVQTLTLTDTGDQTLTLGPSAFTVANDPNAATQDAALFTLVNASSAPATLSPGDSFGLQLRFSANAITTNSAILQIATNDPVNATQSVTLRGIGTGGLGGTNQPSLATILRAYNIPTIVGEGPNDANASTDTTYPEPADPSSQEVALQRLQKAGNGPVTITTLASFTSSGFSKSYVLGTYSPSNPAVLNQLFYTPSTENQTTNVHPQGSTSFDPGNNAFGFYFISNTQVTGRVGYTEDALNTWDTTDPRKFRFFPMEKPDGTVVPNTYVMTSTDWNAPAGYDFANIVAVVTNVKAAQSTGPVLSLRNMNAVPGSETMVFNNIVFQNTSVGDQMHNTGVLQVTNTGDSPLIINSYSTTTGFHLQSPPTFPLTIAAGSSYNLTVLFSLTGGPSVPYNETSDTLYPNDGGVQDGTLTLHTNDSAHSTSTTPLAGWYQKQSENDMEPNLQSIANLLFDWGTEINSSPIVDLVEDPATSGTVPTYYGEETVSAYWTEADPGQTVGVQQIAAYHTEGNTAVTYWFAQGGSSHSLFTTSADYGQTLFPFANNTSAPAAATFSTTGNFSFRVDSEYSDDTRNSIQTGGGHHFRFYPLRTAAGVLVPNDYLMSMDYGATSDQNFDFQDNVWIVTNIRPTQVKSVSTPQTSAAPPSVVNLNAIAVAGGNQLQWAPVSDTNLAGYNIYSASSFAGPYTELNVSPVTSVNYLDTTAPAAGTSYYMVTAYDSVLHTESLGTSTFIGNTIGNGTIGDGMPVGLTSTVTTRVNRPIVVGVAAGSTDNQYATVLATSVAITSAPSHGTVVVNAATGAVTFSPVTGFSGSDSFQYTVSDTSGITSAPATITIVVTAGNPVGANLSKTLTENTTATLNVLASATDASGTITPSSLSITQAPGHGTATIDPTTHNILYTPAIGYLGTDSIYYTIADNTGSVSTASKISLTITDVVFGNPIAANLSFNATANIPLTINAAAGATDTTASIVATSIVIKKAPSHGTATIDPVTGNITYTPTHGYTGSDTIQYTIGDNLSAVSPQATISLTVAASSLPGPTGKAISATSVVSGGATTIDVLASATDGIGTITPSSVIITAAPLHGSVTVSSSSGVISYTASPGFVGSDSLQYTFSDNYNLISSPATVSLNVGVTINSTTAKLLTFTDSSGSTTTVALTGPGSAQVFFSGSGTSQNIPGAHGTGTVLVTGKTLAISGIAITGSTAASTLTITQSSGKSAAVSGISDNGPLGKIVALTSTLKGIMTFAGSLGSLQAAAISGAAITIGSAGAKPGGFMLTAGHVTTTTLASALPIKAIKATDWTMGSVTAPTITTLTTTGNFVAGITATGVSPFSLGKITIGGQLGGAWNITGASTTILVGSVASTFNGNFSRAINTFTDRAGTFAGTLTATSINSLSITGNDTGHITAGAIKSLKVTGSLSSATITLTGGGTSLAHLTVTGSITGSTITDAGTIGAISIAGRGAKFVATDINVQAIGSISIGTVTTSNAGVRFGITANTIGSLAATLDTGKTLRLTRATLGNATALSSYLSVKNIVLNDFVI